MSKINIVMAAYNSSELTNRTIYSVLKNTKIDYKFIIINNGSADNTDEVVRKFLPNDRILYLQSGVNNGCGIGRNIGLRNIDADCDYVILIDNDIYAPSEWDLKLVDFMGRHPRIGLGGPSTNFAGSPQLIANVPKMESDEEVEEYARKYKSKKEFSEVPKKWPVIGFCQIIRKEVIDKVGLFDESFRLYGCEDNDFCYRVERAGWNLAYIDSIFVYHHGHGGLSNLGAEGTIQWGKNRDYFKEKNGFL